MMSESSMDTEKYNMVMRARVLLDNNGYGVWSKDEITALKMRVEELEAKLEMVKSVGFEIVNDDDGRLALKGHGTIYMQEQTTKGAEG
jgi:hypothetical protein